MTLIKDMPVKQYSLAYPDMKVEQFDCNFNDKELARHLNYDCNKIVFVRGWFYGKVGDYTYVGDWSIGESYKYVLTEQYSINMCALPTYKYLYREAGFRTKQAFEDEIHRIYGYHANRLLIIHVLEIVSFSKPLPLHIRLLHIIFGYNYK